MISKKFVKNIQSILDDIGRDASESLELAGRISYQIHEASVVETPVELIPTEADTFAEGLTI